MDPVLVERFALEGGRDLARGDGAAARKHRRPMLVDDVRLRWWDGRRHTVLREAMHARFRQHE